MPKSGFLLAAGTALRPLTHSPGCDGIRPWVSLRESVLAPASNGRSSAAFPTSAQADIGAAVHSTQMSQCVKKNTGGAETILSRYTLKSWAGAPKKDTMM